MKLAWFRPSTPARDALSNVEGRANAVDPASAVDATAALIAELQSTLDLHVFTRGNAHDFVWRHFRAPYDLCVFELDNSASYAFIWPYLLHYGGVLLLRTLSLHDSRAQALVREQRLDDYAAEFSFNEGHPPSGTRQGTWPMLRVPIMASRLTVLPHRGMVEVLREQYPQARIAYAPLGAREMPAKAQPAPGSAVTFGVLASDRVASARRALARAQAGGAAATLIVEASPERLLHGADVIVSLSWPSSGEPQTFALAAMAAGRPVVVLETEFTADWPALDPQTWQPRGLGTDSPIAVSIDLRDEEHSLAVAIGRLSRDAALRIRLGTAAHAWWGAHATVRGAAEAWQRILHDAATLDRPPRPADWPPHLDADGTERARAILDEFGVSVDLF